jgi:antitoxin component of RelBE/YafQ-DinJ toxin-antitoxin module
MTALRSVTIKIHQDMFEQIKVIAEKRGETTSETVRYLLKKGITEKVYEENTDLIASVIKTQVEQALKYYAIYPSLDNVENPINSTAIERLVLSRHHKNSNMPS